jgi:uncharacterized protein (DUF2062 family)
MQRLPPAKALVTHTPIPTAYLSIFVETTYNFFTFSFVPNGWVSGMGLANSLIRARAERLASALRRTYERFIRIRGQPREIALGLALGIFMGISPLFGFQLILAVFIAALLKWNKIAAAMGTLISNPLTTPFIYTFAYYVGNMAMRNPAKGRLVIPRDLETVVRMLEEAPRLFLTLTVGTVLIGLPLAIAGYFLAHAAVLRYREKIKEKLVAKRKELAQRREKLGERSSRKKRLTDKSKKRHKRL